MAVVFSQKLQDTNFNQYLTHIHQRIIAAIGFSLLQIVH